MASVSQSPGDVMDSTAVLGMKKIVLMNVEAGHVIMANVPHSQGDVMALRPALMAVMKKTALISVEDGYVIILAFVSGNPTDVMVLYIVMTEVMKKTVTHVTQIYSSHVIVEDVSLKGKYVMAGGTVRTPVMNKTVCVMRRDHWNVPVVDVYRPVLDAIGSMAVQTEVMRRVVCVMRITTGHATVGTVSRSGGDVMVY